MRQQINLYQPIFRQERKLFSATTVASACGIILLGQLAIWAFGSHKVGQLEQEIAHLRQQAAAQEQMVNTAAALRAERSNPAAIQASISKLKEEVAMRSRALDVLRSGSVGEPVGFASRLEALARGHLQGVWLDHLVLTGAPGNDGSVQIEGATLDPDLVPRYLQQLANEPVLRGTRFAQFVIERPDEKKSEQPTPGVRFSATGAELVSDKEST